MSDELPVHPPPSDYPPPVEPGRPAVLSSRDLLQGSREVWIDHEGQLYRLRVTSQGKLYLTK
jgi:hemin uptake protein HemP